MKTGWTLTMGIHQRRRLLSQRLCRTLFAAAAAWALAGCATYKPAQFSGGAGHSCAVLGPAEFSVTFAGSGFATPDDVKASWHRRAAELCGGTDYKADPGIAWHQIGTMVGGTGVVVPNAIGKLTCAAPVPVARQASDKDTQDLIVKAEAGDAESQFGLAAAYDVGLGVCKSPPEAERWYRRASQSGSSNADYRLGLLLQQRQEYGEALLWYERAARTGHPLALNNLASLHDAGLGTRQDRGRALRLYLASAERGWPEAMSNLANMYAAGQGGPVDAVAACTWIRRARDHSRESDRVLRARLDATWRPLQPKMSEEQRAKCDADARAWQPAR